MTDVSAEDAAAGDSGEVLALKALIAELRSVLRDFMSLTADQAEASAKGTALMLEAMRERDELKARCRDLEEGERAAEAEVARLREERDEAKAFEEGQADRCVDLQQSLHKRSGELEDLRAAARRFMAEVRGAGESMMGANARLAMTYTELERVAGR